MSKGLHGPRHARGALALVAVLGSISGFAQDASYSPDPGGMTIDAQACADEHGSSEERIRACTIIIKDGGLRGRDLANMYLYRARAERAARGEEDAARDLDLAIKADERYPIAYFERGNYHAGNGDNAQAIEDYDRAIRLKRTHPEFFINRGNAHKDLGELEAAVQDYSEAIRLNPDHAVALFNRSVAYAKLGKRDLSAQDRARAIKLDPTLAQSAAH
jgi:tetratricopeptide (TPR) repeat protein